MGNQLAFYATQNDEAAFVDEIERLGGAFIHSAFQQPEEMVVPSLPVIEGVPPRNVEYLLFCPSIEHSLVISSYETGVHAISQGDSCIIQITRSLIMGPIIFDGRLWYERHRDDGARKPDEFITWAEQIFAWISTNYLFQREGVRGYYLGPDVVARLRDGNLKLA